VIGHPGFKIMADLPDAEKLIRHLQEARDLAQKLSEGPLAYLISCALREAENRFPESEA